MKTLNKLFLPLLSICLMCNICFAQNNGKNDYRKFVSSFTSKIAFPNELMKNCVPTFCLIKVNVDSAMSIVDMQLSDSADSLLVLEFNKHKNEIDLKLLERCLKADYKSDSGDIYLIPFSYGMLAMNCNTQAVSLTTLCNYNKFNGKFIIGKVVLLDPIYIKFGVQR